MTKQPYSKVDQYEFNQDFSDNNAYIKQSGLKGFGLFKYQLKVWLAFKNADKLLKIVEEIYLASDGKQYGICRANYVGLQRNRDARRVHNIMYFF